MSLVKIFHYSKTIVKLVLGSSTLEGLLVTSQFTSNTSLVKFNTGQVTGCQ